MGVAQTQKAEEDIRVVLPNNPLVPSEGDICYIKELPPELLSRIFEVGSADDGGEDKYDKAADFWENHPDTNDEDAHDSDGEMKEESEDEGEEDDEEEETDEGDSDETASSDFLPPWPPFAIVVSHVCRHWRNVAFSTPSLWTTIVVPPVARPPYEPVSTLLDRSKSLPIDIYVDCEPHDDEECDFELPSEDDLKYLYSMLIPHIKRWRTMEVSVSEYPLMYVFLNAISDPSISAAPQLTTLELYHHEETEEFDTFAYLCMSKHFTLFGGWAPLLTRIVLWGVHVDWDQPWIASASNLTDLELAFHAEDVRPSWAQFASILRGASSLEQFSLRQSGPSREPAEWFIESTLGCSTDLNAPIQLSRLTDLTLAFHSQSRVVGLVHKFCLPALKNLTLDFDNGDYTNFVNELARPATSLSPRPSQEQSRSLLSRLESLKIAGLPCDAYCIKTIYGELQNLTSLNISLTYLPLDFMEILCTPCELPGRGDIWLPRLVTLYVSGTFGDSLRVFVKKRKELGVPLNSLYVEESCDVNDKDVAWLRANVKSFEFFEGSDDEDEDNTADFVDLHEEIDQWTD